MNAVVEESSQSILVNESDTAELLLYRCFSSHRNAIFLLCVRALLPLSRVRVRDQRRSPRPLTLRSLLLTIVINIKLLSITMHSIRIESLKAAPQGGAGWRSSLASASG